MSPVERLMFGRAAESPALADTMAAFGTRNMGPARMMVRALPLSLAVAATSPLRRRAAATPRATAAEAAR
jgi:hypothetical protein